MITQKKIISRSQLSQLIPYSLTHISRLENRGEFPKRLQLGENRVGWLLSEVEDWIDQRAKTRDSAIQ